MARKRSRRGIAWDTVLGVLFAANIFAGLYASRLTSLIKIRVEGALPEDQTRIKGILERTHSKPALQLDRLATESAILAKSEVATAEMTRNIFGRARVAVTYRQPVAATTGRKGMAMSRDGVVFQTLQPLNGLPKVLLPEFAMSPVVGVVGPWRYREIAHLASLVKPVNDRAIVEIEATKDGGLCLNIGSKFAVELGLPEALDAKVEYLSKQIENDPAILTKGQTLILISLDKASYRVGVGRKNK